MSKFKFEVGDQVRDTDSYPTKITGADEDTPVTESDKALRGREGAIVKQPNPEVNFDQFYDVDLGDKYTYLLAEDEIEIR